LSAYKKAKHPDKKADHRGCSSYEVSELLTPQQIHLEQGHFTHNFCDLPINDPTALISEKQTLISRLGNSDGKTLDSKTRNRMENDFGYNFGSVRVHTDNYATNLTGALNAKATCYGQDIYFGKNQFAPNTQEGADLLKHELTHYQQQTQTGTKKIQNQEAEAQTQKATNLRISLFPEMTKQFRESAEKLKAIDAHWKKTEKQREEKEKAWRAVTEGKLSMATYRNMPDPLHPIFSSSFLFVRDWAPFVSEVNNGSIIEVGSGPIKLSLGMSLFANPQIDINEGKAGIQVFNPYARFEYSSQTYKLTIQSEIGIFYMKININDDFGSISSAVAPSGAVKAKFEYNIPEQIKKYLNIDTGWIEIGAKGGLTGERKDHNVFINMGVTYDFSQKGLTLKPIESAIETAGPWIAKWVNQQKFNREPETSDTAKK